jgi:hypothetical protein
MNRQRKVGELTKKQAEKETADAEEHGVRMIDEKEFLQKLKRESDD